MPTGMGHTDFCGKGNTSEECFRSGKCEEGKKVMM